MRLTDYSTLFPLWHTHTRRTSSSQNETAANSTLRPRGDGYSQIDLNIGLSSYNTQTSISDSFSAILSKESVKEVQLLIETFVKGVEEVFGRV